MENSKNFLNLLEKWQSDNNNSEVANKLLKFVDKIIYDKKVHTIDRKIWFNYLDISHRPVFLQTIHSLEKRTNWVESVFIILQQIDYSVKDLIEQRVEEHPDRVLFQDMSYQNTAKWTYIQAYRQIKEIAALFLKEKKQARVAIYTQNNLNAAMTDIACLMYDIYNTPLNVHFNKATIAYIFKQLDINIVIADTKARLKILKEIKSEYNISFTIYSVVAENTETDEIFYLQQKSKELNSNEVEDLLSKRNRLKNNQVATTMFTSGSTGVPKGVSFSTYNLVSKRFARGAALPKLGEEEIMLCYLPLYHTFGRYLEMLGTIYWHGTYVFVGNTSKETLLDLFPKINPTIFISIPLRWQNLYNKCLNINEDPELELTRNDLNVVVGNKLKWGLSAAGYLAPKVFTFFEKHNIQLGSGFGMTEATGGITMTLPEKYKSNSVGIPLPGVYTRLKDNGELELQGHYIAKYLEDAQPYQTISFPATHSSQKETNNAKEEYWLSTGDIFTIDKNNHHEIIDRVKDIYKNNKGQTVAPRVVEKKFNRVPGIKNVFLVGDGKPYNVLLIVPNHEDTVLQSTSDSQEYFHQIVMAANKDIAPYERVVNFTVLSRDFSVDKEELTPKGSFNRKKIEHNFTEEIKKLYVSNTVVLEYQDYEILIPRWFFRDLSILETDIELNEIGLFNKRTNQSLVVKKTSDNTILIGDFIYTFDVKKIDFGIISRQPKLWLGNYQVIQFCPIKESWDIALNNIENYLKVPFELNKRYNIAEIETLKRIKNPTLVEINKHIILSLFSEVKVARIAIKKSGELLNQYEDRISAVLKLRLQALAYSSIESLRSLTYRMLLLNDPNPNHQKWFPAFLESGKSFLNEISIDKIASSNIGKQQLQALRQRLFTYRTHLDWEISHVQQLQFENLLKLLYNFTRKKFEYLPAVRSELSSWAVHTKNEKLSQLAQMYVSRLFDNFSEFISASNKDISEETWESLIVFGIGVSEQERERIMSIFKTTYFFQKSVILAFEEPNFDMTKIKEKGIWIVKLLALKDFVHYRVSINTVDFKHYDLHVVVSRDINISLQTETLYWMAAISGYSFGARTVPALGFSNSSHGILSTQYIGGLTVWDKIKEFSDSRQTTMLHQRQNKWRKLFIKALSVFFRAWKISEYRIVPGIIAPSNVVVPELDFQKNTMIVTLTNWVKYENTLSLIEPIVREFYCKTAALYPWSKKITKFEWIFEACIEALGNEEAYLFFENLKKDLDKVTNTYATDNNMSKYLSKFLLKMENKFYFPLSMFNAAYQYYDWTRINPIASLNAKEQTISELIELYNLDIYPEIVRYKFYQKTYFVNKDKQVQEKFDILINKMRLSPASSPLQLLELSELQSIISDKKSREVFSKMVFPTIRSKQKFQLQKRGNKAGESILLKSEIEDKKGKIYTLREPIDASEVGQLYQLFYKENYPKQISNMDKHLVVSNSFDRIVGGLSYRELENKIVLLDGLVVNSTLQGQRLGSAIIEDFFTRMSTRGVRVIKAHFLFGNYYLKHNFKVDKKWGALVKFL